MKLESLSRWWWRQFLRFLPLALFLALGALSLVAERDPSVPQIVAVVIMGGIAVAWTVPELRKGPKVEVNRELSPGNRLLEDGDYAGARSYFEELHRRYPEHPSLQAHAIHNSAIACLRLGDFEEARRRFITVMESGWPNSLPLRGTLGVLVPNALAWLEVLSGNLGEALRLQKIALARVPERARDPYRTVDAALALREGRIPEAMRWLQRLSSLPSSPQRDAVLGVLWGFAVSQQGAELDVGRIAVIQQAPGTREWMGRHWPELAAWMEERGLAQPRTS